MPAPMLFPMAMKTKHEVVFKALGARIAQARKEHGVTQQQLAGQLGILQQALAHYEVARARISASMLPTLTHAYDPAS